VRVAKHHDNADRQRPAYWSVERHALSDFFVDETAVRAAPAVFASDTAVRAATEVLLDGAVPRGANRHAHTAVLNDARKLVEPDRHTRGAADQSAIRRSRRRILAGY